MSDMLLLALIGAALWIGWQLHMVTTYLRQRYMPTGRNEESTSVDVELYENEAEPRQGR